MSGSGVGQTHDSGKAAEIVVKTLQDITPAALEQAGKVYMGSIAKQPYVSDKAEFLYKPIGTDFMSGAKRSERKLPWWMLPLDAVEVIVERFAIGAKKYAAHNWKRAVGSGDVEFVRELVNHINDHWKKFMQHVGDWSNDREGETPLQNLGAIGWGIVALIYYCIHDQKLVMEALNQEVQK